MNNYPEIKVPGNIVQDNSRMSLQDVQNYFDWFMAIKDERLKLFCEQVFESGQVELAADKLQAIQYFLKDHLAVRKRTNEEIEQEKAKLPEALQKIHKVPEYEMVEPTFSVIFDLSIYYGDTLIRDVTGLKWTAEKDSQLVDYGYPILVKENASNRLCPGRILEVLAKQVYEGRVAEDRLFNLYQTHKNGFEGKRKNHIGMVKRWSRGKK